MHIVTLEELMANVRRVLHRVQAGDRLMITQEDEPVVFITPAEENNPLTWKHRAAAEGKIRWDGRRLKLPDYVMPDRGDDVAAIVRQMRDECQ